MNLELRLDFADLDGEGEGLTMPGKAAKVQLSEKQQAILEEFSRSRSVPQAVRQRSRIVLLGFERLENQEIADEVGLIRQQVGVWRRRWQAAWEALCVCGNARSPNVCAKRFSKS